MTTFVNNDVASGAVVYASDHNTQGALLGAVLNGGIDNANINSSAAIATSKLADDAGITAAKIATGAVTPSKLSLGAQTATVATSETTTSTSFTSLATTTDTVTVTIGSNGLALVTVSCSASHSLADSKCFMGFAVSGANTIAASDAKALESRLSTATATDRFSYTTLLTGLTAGSTTFAAKYHVAAGTGTFSNREISVVPL